MNFNRNTKKECIIDQYFNFIDYNISIISKYKIGYFQLKNDIIYFIERYNLKIIERRRG